MDFSNLSPDDLAQLQDMFGKNSPALKEALGQARQKALESTLSKPLAEDIVKQSSKTSPFISEKTSAFSDLPPSSEYEGSALKKPLAEDLVKSQSLPGKTAQESAKVFEEAMPSGIEEGKGIELYKQLAKIPKKRSLSSIAKTAGKGIVGLVGGELVGEALFPQYANEGADVPLPWRNPISQAELNALSQPSESPLSSLLASLPKTSAAEPVAKDSEEESEQPEPSEKQMTPKLSASAPTPRMPTLNQAFPLPTTDTELVAAQEAANRNRLFAGLGRAASQVGGALAAVGSHGITAPSRPDVSQFEELQKTAESPVQDIIARRQAEAQNLKLQTERVLADPNSDISKQFRSLFAKYMPGMKIPENTSAQDIQASGYGKIAEQLAAVDLKRQEHQASLSDKAKQKTNEEFEKLSKLMNADIASSRSAFGTAARNKQAVQNAMVLFEGGDLGNLDSRQTLEAARVLDRVLSGGSPTIAATEHLDTPRTVDKYIAEIMEKLTNKRQGVKAGSFLQNMKKTFEREGQNADRQIKETQKKIYGGFSHLKEKDPTRWNEMMSDFGLNETSEVKQEDPVQAYADKYLGGNYKAAVELLKKRGQL